MFLSCHKVTSFYKIFLTLQIKLTRTSNIWRSEISGLTEVKLLWERFKYLSSPRRKNSLGNSVNLLRLRFSLVSFSSLPISFGTLVSRLSWSCHEMLCYLRNLILNSKELTFKTVKLCRFSIFGEIEVSEFELTSRFVSSFWFHHSSSSSFSHKESSVTSMGFSGSSRCQTFSGTEI